MNVQPVSRHPKTAPDEAASLVVLSSISRFIDIFGDPWSVLLLRDVYLGVTRFEDFQKNLGITRQTLSNRLQTFGRHGILVKAAYQDRPARYEYRLTEKGRELADFALMIWVWQNRWAGSHSLLPRVLRHRSCGYFLVPQMVCAECRSPLELADISVEAGPGLVEPPQLTGRGRRWAALETRREGTTSQNLLKGTYVIGDRWSNLILAGVLLGIRSFDAMVSVLGISTN
ncbi:MAG: helix-turn-helix domain-containing protein, partial [Bauldia litoralis]